MIDLIDALADDQLFGPWFVGDSWRPWRAVLKSACGHKLDDNELEIFHTVARRDPPPRRVRELWVVAGRRAGKDSVASAVAAHASGFVDYGPVLRPGELASILCLAVDKLQAKIVLRYTKAFFDRIPMLAELVTRETADGLNLSTQAELSVIASNFRSVRGRSIALAILDECAFWRDEASTSPDVETYNALLPGLVTIPGAMLVGLSSPYRKAGLLYQKWKDHFGKCEDDVLVIQAPSRALNPTLPQRVIDEAIERDPAAARSEWLGEWRDDITCYITIELIQSAVDVGVLVRPPRDGLRYVGFVDAASGVGRDSYAVCVAHSEGTEIIVDLIHEIRPPFDPTKATAEVCALLKGYRINSVRGDKYAAGFVIEAHAKCGISYAYSEKDTSQNYLEALPLFTSGRVRLVDNRRVVAQFAGLERRTGAGRDRVDHGSGDRHDDGSAATAGALALVSTGGAPMVISAEALRLARIPPRGGTYRNRVNRFNQPRF